jgi:hypothetical protein
MTAPTAADLNAPHHAELQATRATDSLVIDDA